MIAMFIGVLVFLLGAAIMASARYVARSVFGFVCLFVGGGIFGMGVVDIFTLFIGAP